MKRALLALIAVVVAIGSPCTAQIQTVELSVGDPIASFTIASKTEASTNPAIQEIPAKSWELIFSLPSLPEGATLSRCRLRVVPLPHEDPANQDVTISLNGKQVGLLSTFQRTGEVVGGELRPEACVPGIKRFMLMTPSRRTSWEYYGNGAKRIANQPRLILTYTLPASTPERSGQTTSWKYHALSQPCHTTATCLDSHFTSLWTQFPSDPLTNLVTYKSAVYAVVGSPAKLYRVSGPGQMVAKEPALPDFSKITANSYAVVNAQGRLRIVTENLVVSCDLPTWDAPGGPSCFSNRDEIKVSPGEPPAIGPDGSLYFRNVEENGNGSVEVLGPRGSILWITSLKLTAVSPIALSANGLHAYMLADIADETPGATHMIELLSIDTATGEEVATPIKDQQNQSPALKTFLRPVVSTKQNPTGKDSVDYVFVAGNTNDTGILQLVAFEPRKHPLVVWTRPGKVSANPVLSVKDGNSLFVAQNASMVSVPWYSKGAISDKDLNYRGLYAVGNYTLELARAVGGEQLLVDGDDNVYTNSLACNMPVYTTTRTFNGSECRSLRVENNNPYGYGLDPTAVPSFFTSNGVLIGYRDRSIYDLSPKGYTEPFLNLGQLQPWTIYTADWVKIDPSPTVNTNRPIILKGFSIQLPQDFNPSLYPGLSLQIVPK